jgi:hypothetical protein
VEGRAGVGKGGEIVDSEYMFFGQNFARFRHEKYDFELYKGVYIKKMAQIVKFQEKKNPNRLIFTINSSK